MAHKRKNAGRRTRAIASSAVQSPIQNIGGTFAPGGPRFALPDRIAQLLGEGGGPNLIQAAAQAPRGVPNQGRPSRPGRIALVPPARRGPRTAASSASSKPSRGSRRRGSNRSGKSRGGRR